MNKAGKPNALLIELVIVLLFFSLSAAVILQLFIGAHDKSVRSSTDSVAIIMAEDMAERFLASDLTADAFLTAEGFTLAEGAYILSTQADGRSIQMVAEPSRQEGMAGNLDEVTLTVCDGDLTILTIPVSRYLPKEDLI